MGKSVSYVRSQLRVGICIVFSLILSSCITTREDMMYLNDQIVALNTRVNNVQASMDKKLSNDFEERINERLDSKLESEFEAIRTNQAEIVSEMSQLKNSVQELAGRVEENSHLTQRAIERDTTEQDAVTADMNDLINRLNELEMSVKGLNQYLALEAASDKKEPQTTPADKKEKKETSEAEDYDATLGLYRKGGYEEAISGFRGFLKKYPKSDLADNAQFWIGESYMALKQYEQAILAYQEVIKRFPKGNKVPNAMYRQALAFNAIDDKTSAKLLLKKIIKKFPGSSEAKLAGAKLKMLK